MITPFTYQGECLGCINHARSMGETRALVVMATRLGKTITAAFDFKRFLGGKKTRLLYLCHKTDILYQARSEFELILGQEKTFGFFHGKEKNFHEVDCLFSSFETVRNYIDIFDPEEFDYIVVDESHHSHAETYLPIIRFFKPKFLLGITATPNRMDLKDITEIYGKPVFELPLEKALALGYLTPLDYRILTDEIEIKKILEIDGKKWSVSALNHQIFVPKRDKEIARIIAMETSRIKDAKTIIFCSSVNHCDQLVRLIPDSLTIHSKIPQKERDIRLEMFRSDMLNTVITVDCFNEGIDIPRANVIVFLRSTASRTIFLQQLGRGLTKSEGKDKVIVLDFVANIERIKAVQEMYRKVKELLPAQRPRRPVGNSEPITLEIGKVLFHERKIGLTDLLERILKKEPYLTWQEAQKAAIILGICSVLEYHNMYRKDPRLPSNPTRNYEDFPGWIVFLQLKNYYPTWQEASKAAQNLGIKFIKAYLRGAYKSDPKLPPRPDLFYADYPGGIPFLGRKEKEFYSTWRKASKAAKNLGIRGKDDYIERYRVDCKLPSTPQNFYSNFPGWPKFLGNE